MNILLIAYYFPPRNTVASHRLHSFAWYWQAAGHRVTVLCPTEVHGDSRLDLPENGWEYLKAPRSAFHNRALGLNRPARSAANNTASGKAARATDTAKPGRSAAKRTTRRKSRRLIGMLIGALNSLSLRLGIFRELRMPSFADLWLKPALRRVSADGRIWDAVVSSSHPYVTHEIARRLRRRGRALTWIADFRDPWTASGLYRGMIPFRWIENFRERRIFHSADAVSTVGNVLADAWEQRFGRRPLVVFNGYSEFTGTGNSAAKAGGDLEAAAATDGKREPAGNAPANSGAAENADPLLHSGRINLLYTGSLYPGKRDPSPLLQAVARLRDEGRDVSGLHALFVGNDGGFLAGLIENYALEGLVGTSASVSHARALELQNGADVLVFIESGAPEDRGNITGKIFEYLKTGKPILALGITEDSEAWSILAESGRGFLAGSADEAAEYLERLLDGGIRESGPACTPGADTISRYSREHAADTLLKEIEQLAGEKA